MHGLIFASLRDFTAFRLDEERAVELWADRIFETTEAYDDQWFAAQLDRLVAASGDPMDEVQRRFGSFAAQTTFVGLYPAFYEKERGHLRVPPRDRGENPRAGARDDRGRVPAEAPRAAPRRAGRPRLVHV